jgi:hypothetical protein
MPSPSPDFLSLLEELAGRNVDFIVVGGVGAVLQGAPIATFDIDLVHSRAPENLDRLVPALVALDAYDREHADRRLRPSTQPLAGPGHHLLMTRAGPLDLLGAVTPGWTYEDLVGHTIQIEIAPGLTVMVLDLRMLVRLKEELGREKDLAVLPVLRRTLEERGRA